MADAAHKPPLRVGLVIGQLTVGGAEGQLLQLVRGLGADVVPFVYALSARPTHLHSALVEHGVAVREITGHPALRALRLARALRRDRVAVAHAWLFIANAYLAVAKLLGGRWRMATSARNCKVQGWVSRIANAIAFRMSALVVVNSADVEAYIVEEYAAPRTRIRVVPNGVDTDRFRPPGSLVESNPVHVVTVGRLVRQKNHDLFLRGAAGLLQSGVAARFTIVGDGPLRADLEARARARGVGGRVALAGERQDVGSVLGEAALVWLTSSWEGMPNAVLEALASGVPVVVTAVSGTRELVEPGVQGEIVDLDDATALVARSRAILEEPERRRRMAAAARQRALAFSSGQMAARLANLYAELGRTGA